MDTQQGILTEEEKKELSKKFSLDVETITLMFKVWCKGHKDEGMTFDDFAERMKAEWKMMRGRNWCGTHAAMTRFREEKKDLAKKFSVDIKLVREIEYDWFRRDAPHREEANKYSLFTEWANHEIPRRKKIAEQEKKTTK